MSIVPENTTVAPALTLPVRRALTLTTIVSAISIALFIDTQIVVVAAATVWSVTTYLHLPLFIGAVLAILIGVPAIWACYKIVRLAFAAETEVDEE